MLDGLAFLHKSRIIHRDLKCENIFINGQTGDVRMIGEEASELSELQQEQEELSHAPGTPSL